MQQANNTYPFYGPEDIKRYLSGSMSAQEMHDMEKAALKDPLLADAIDGFRNADPVVTNAHLNAIKASILGLSRQEPVAAPIVPLHASSRNNWWRWVAAACSLGLIAGSIWWFTQRTEPGIKPLARIDEPTQTTDTVPGIAADAPAATVKEQALPDEAPVTQNMKAPPSKSGLEEKTELTETAVLPKISQPPALQKMMADKAGPPTATFFYKPGAKKGEVLNDSYASPIIEATSVAPSSSIAENESKFSVRKAMAAQPVVHIQGQVVSKEGDPIPYASVSIPGNNGITTKKDGSFVLPVYDSSFEVSVKSVGFRPAIASLRPGKQNQIILDKDQASTNLDEMVVIGNNNTRKKRVAYLEDARKAQAAAASANEIIYPEEGWGNFYEELGTSLGVNKSKTTKTLQIKFTVDENGDPVDFEVVESPDALLTKKAIEFIKNAKWKNFKLDKNALVKIEVN